MFDTIADKLNRIDVSGLGNEALGDAAAHAGRVRSALDALDMRIAAAIADLEDVIGATHTLRTARKCSKREAERIVNRADGLKEMPSVQQALRNGDITAEHADALARAANDTSAEAVEKSGILGRFAKGRPADIAGRDIRTWAGQHQHTADKEATHRRQRTNRKLVVFDGDHGMKVLHGAYDPTCGAEVQAEIDAEYDRLLRLDGGRDRADKIRTPQQRRADALYNLITGKREGVIADGTDTGRINGTASRPQLVAVFDAGTVTGTDPHGRCEIPGVGPLPRSVLERLACDADLYAVVLSGTGDPLWMSRRTRTVTPAQYRALIVRDGGCVICAAKPNHCEAHHIVPWAPPGRGPTDIDNLALLCVRHHHQLHDQGQTLIRGPDNRWQMGPSPPTAQEAA